MTEPVTAIPNLGPATAAAFAAAGITSAEALRELGADAAYRRLIDAGSRPHFIAYYALAMGLQGRPWTDCRGSEKARLRRRFDAICSEGRAALEAALDEIGVRHPRRAPEF